MEAVSRYSTDELCDYLIDRVHQSALFTLREQRIDGAMFLQLTENDLKDLLPQVGERLSVAMALRQLKKKTESCDHHETSTSKLKTPQQKPNCPSRSDWVHSFHLPQRFNKTTIEAIENRELTKNARADIVTALHSRMLEYQEYPTPYEYRTACKRLVEMFPAIGDKSDSGFGTWKEQLKQKFRNGRRSGVKRDLCVCDETSKETNDSLPTKPPKANKKRRLASGEHNMDEAEGDDYETGVQNLAKELQKPNPSNSAVKKLMKATYSGRRVWIQTDTPSVLEVLDVFPPLMESRRLHRELTLITGVNKSHDFLEDWPLWMDKLMDYGRLEAQSRTAIRSVMAQYEDTSDSDPEQQSEDVKSLCSVQLLQVLLANKAKVAILHEFPDSTDLDNEVAKFPAFPQVIAVFSDMGRQYFVAVEKRILVESKSMKSAIVDMMAAYFTFDIQYPKALYSVLIFLQHHVFNVRDEQRVPNNVTILISSVNK